MKHQYLMPVGQDQRLTDATFEAALDEMALGRAPVEVRLLFTRVLSNIIDGLCEEVEDFLSDFDIDAEVSDLTPELLELSGLELPTVTDEILSNVLTTLGICHISAIGELQLDPQGNALIAPSNFRQTVCDK